MKSYTMQEKPADTAGFKAWIRIAEMARILIVFICLLLSTVTRSWFPNEQEWKELCQHPQWKDMVLPLLREPDKKSIVQWLIKPLDSKGDTPIHICVRSGNADLLDELLRKFKSNNRDRIKLVECRDSSYMTPLICAASNDQLSVVQCLLEYGASASTRDKYGYTPLHWAAHNGHLRVMQCLVESERLSFADGFEVGETPLHVAACRGRLPVVQYLLAKGVPASVFDKRGTTPLHWAAREGHLSVVQCLLVKGEAATNGTDLRAYPL